jgi:predicted transcriptional regulator
VWSTVEAIQEHATNRRREPHRGEYEIINEILKIVSYSDSTSSPDRKRCKPIDIVYGCCLTWHQFQLYRNQLMRLNLINSIQTDGHQFYEITEKGLKYLQLFSELQAEMKPLLDFSPENT